MSSTSLLLIIIGVFVIINSKNFVGVFQGNNTFLSTPATTSTTTSTSSGGTGGNVGSDQYPTSTTKSTSASSS